MSIEDYSFTGAGVLGAESDGETVSLFVMGAKGTALTKDDIIAMAKAVRLTAHDIDCSEFRALQIDANAADEDHY